MNVRLRSANRGNSNNVWNVNTAGYLNNNNANNAYRALPDRVSYFPLYGLRIARIHGDVRHKEPNPCREIGEQQAVDVVGNSGMTLSPVRLYTTAIIDVMDDEAIIGFEALWHSMMKCRRGVLWKDSAANFCLDAVKEVSRLCDQLHDGTYTERPHKYFTVTYPKERSIMSISFRDRVYQRSLNDVAIYPAMSRSFIYDNAACQKWKGADFARERFRCHLQRFYRKHGANGYVLKMDVRGYYPNMRHDVAKAAFRRYLDLNVYDRAAAILDGFPGDVGFNPGSQIIQIAGISVLNPIDHYIKEQLRVKHYMRYMDDMLLLGTGPAALEAIRQDIAVRLKALGFELHPEKTRITLLSEGVMYLGFIYHLTPTGKVIMTLDPARVRAERKKLYRLAQIVKAGRLPRRKADESYCCWRSHASKGNSYMLIRRMDLYYKSLWR